MGKLDLITLEVVKNSFLSIADEMSASLIRSSYSPIIREMLDASCAIFDSEGSLIAQAENIPAQLGFMNFAIRQILAEKGRDWFAPSDIAILNHAYRGGNHSPDIQLFLPVFIGKEMVAVCGNVAHHIDVGGTQPGTEGYDNAEIYQEGILFPPIKLFEKGRPNQAIFEIIKENVRDPKSTLGDLRAQIASNHMGERRLRSLFKKHGTKQVLEYMTEILNQTERQARKDLESLPDGESEAEGCLDDDGVTPSQPVKIKVRVVKRKYNMTVDFSGSDPQMRSGLNLPLSNAYSAAYFALRCLLDPNIPQNDGCYRALEIIAPLGTVVNPKPPAATSARHVTAQRQTDTVIHALAKLYPQRLQAGSCVAFPTFVSEIIEPSTGEIDLQTDILGGGMGGRQEHDGLDGVDVYLSNCGLLPIEVSELESSIRIERTELVPDSGGPGKFRGGLAIRRDYRILADRALVNVYFDQGNPAFTAWGILNGKPGAAAAAIVNPDTPDEHRLKMLKAHLRLGRGDVFTMISSGGGGYGDPFERDPQLIRDDILDGKVSVERAKLEYDVKVDLKAMKVTP